MTLLRSALIATVLLSLSAAPPRAQTAGPTLEDVLTRLATLVSGAVAAAPAATPAPTALFRLETSPPAWRAEPVVSSESPTLGMRVLGTRTEVGEVELRWGGTPPLPPLVVYRQVEQGAWTSLGSARADGSGEVMFIDPTVEPGRRYRYSIGTVRGGPESFSGSVSVVARGAPSLAVRGLTAGANGTDATLSVSVPAVQYTTLEVVDVEGRPVWSFAWTPALAGPQSVRVPRERVPAGGAYEVRLSQGPRTAVGQLTLAD